MRYGYSHRQFDTAGYTPKILVYLRPQAPYAESMYVERVKQGEFFPMSTFIEQILETGAYRPDSAPVNLEFRYTRLLAPWVEAFGKENVVVRPYEPARGTTFIFEDFLATHRANRAKLRAGDRSSSRWPSRARTRALSFGNLLDTTFARLLPTKPPQAGAAYDPAVTSARFSGGFARSALCARDARRDTGISCVLRTR